LTHANTRFFDSSQGGKQERASPKDFPPEQVGVYPLTFWVANAHSPYPQAAAKSREFFAVRGSQTQRLDAADLALVIFVRSGTRKAGIRIRGSARGSGV
jgi:hypothetical protein